MKITKENYEAYLLDLWEGNLSEEEERMLNDFLAAHPELNDDEALFLQDDVSLTMPDDDFDKSSITFDTINENNATYFFIAYHEGDLSTEEQLKVETFVNEHPKFAKEFEQYGRAKMPAENTEFDKSLIAYDSVTENNATNLFIAYHEGDLSSEMQANVETFVKANPAYQTQFDQFKRAKLPTETISFPNKDVLLAGKINTGGRIISLQQRNWIIGIAAASIAAFIWVISPNPNTVDARYALEQQQLQRIENYDVDPINFTIGTVEGQTAFANTYLAEDQKGSVNKEKRNNKSLDFELPVLPIKKGSLASVKADQLNTIILKLNPQENTGDVAEASTNNAVATQPEEIPTILEYTAAYLKRKKVLDSENKPDLKNILNSTLAGVNNDQPVLATNDEGGSKRTVFQLGSFKFEKISKK